MGGRMNSTLDYIFKKFKTTEVDKGTFEILEINRKIMAETLNELGFKKGVEVGVAQGHHSLVLCQNLPGAELYGVDVWDLYPGYNEYTDRIKRYYIEAQQKMAPYPNYHFVKKFSMDAVKDFADNSLDFVYIDGAHDFKNVTDDVCEWSKKVKKGGIVFGHDFKRRHQRWIVDVKDVIMSYSYAKRTRPLFILGTPGNHSDGMYREGGQSWMFVRQEEDLVNYQYVLTKDGYKEIYGCRRGCINNHSQPGRLLPS